MRITMVKLLNDGLNVDWQTTDEAGVTKHSRKNAPEPAPSFRLAVEDLKPEVEALMETNGTWMDTVTVKGLTLSYDDDGAFEASISFSKRFKSGRAKGYSTVQVRQPTDQGQTGSSFMSDALATKVRTVLLEAERYVAGLREQTTH